MYLHFGVVGPWQLVEISCISYGSWFLGDPKFFWRPHAAERIRWPGAGAAWACLPAAGRLDAPDVRGSSTAPKPAVRLRVVTYFDAYPRLLKSNPKVAIVSMGVKPAGSWPPNLPPTPYLACVLSIKPNACLSPPVGRSLYSLLFGEGPS